LYDDSLRFEAEGQRQLFVDTYRTVLAKQCAASQATHAEQTKCTPGDGGAFGIAALQRAVIEAAVGSRTSSGYVEAVHTAATSALQVRLLVQCLAFLRPNDVYKLVQVSQAMRRLGQDAELWFHFYQRRWPAHALMEVNGRSCRGTIDPFLTDWHGLWEQSRRVELQESGAFIPVVINFELEEVQASLATASADIGLLPLQHLSSTAGANAVGAVGQNEPQGPTAQAALAGQAHRQSDHKVLSGHKTRLGNVIARVPPIVLTERNVYHM
jgi:hypothetical protein